MNLNTIPIPTDGSPDPSEDNSIESGPVSVVFRNLEGRLIRLIKSSEMVYGCVAWLTSFPILRALQGKNVALVVQKEDFLRPDTGTNTSDWSRRLRQHYDALGYGPDRYAFPGIVSSLSVCSDPSVKSVRCVGNHNSRRAPAFPRMHNKFLLFADIRTTQEKGEYPETKIVPHTVWTGSFNLTHNATQSFENAVILRDPKIVEAYDAEFSQIFALSEDLDWTNPWIEPTFRIGT